jgi:hypothetical protein
VDDRTRQEGGLYARYEVRIALLEVRYAELEADGKHYWPIVESLRDNRLVADEIARRLREQRTFTLTKVQLLVGLGALFVPSVVGAVVTALLLRGHL